MLKDEYFIPGFHAPVTVSLTSVRHINLRLLVDSDCSLQMAPTTFFT